MSFQLGTNVHWCDCDGRAVFLDVAADRFFCLPERTNDAFLRLAAGSPAPDDIAALQMLCARRILVETGAAAPLAAPPTIVCPTEDLAPVPAAKLADVLCALQQEWRAASLLRTRKFAGLITNARTGNLDPARRPAERTEAAAAIVAASRTASLAARVRDRCLVRAAAVHRLCAQRGVRTALVVGVVAHPFAAHCWVQLGSAVLVGGFEQARLFTPILVVE